ncbi:MULTISPECIES: HNH endonuclease [Kosakonia]|uniref:HNH endonuclease n=1 Tax=Kosakonia TaxID=1330547 RepID=UPI0005ED69CD|nr:MULTISPECIES: hypothetical protein [Kosakonia]RCX06226.1 hypothetical protein DFO56_101365 [Kosakonia sp. AG348]
MFFRSRKQALEHFNSLYSDDEFNCSILFYEIFSKYSYVAEPIPPTNTNQINSIKKVTFLKEASSSFNKSSIDTVRKSKKTAPKSSSVVKDDLFRTDKLQANRIKKIEDEPLSDEAIKAVIACRAKRKQPVPYVYEELSSTSLLNINQHDSDRPRCIYCGDSKSGIVRDHVVSVAWRGGVRHYDRRHTVPSCPQCNSLLGDKPLHNIADRAAFLVAAIERHERKYLLTVDRTVEELAELDHFLAISVRSAMYEKALALQRIEYAKQVAAGYYDYATIKHLVKQGREIPEE